MHEGYTQDSEDPDSALVGCWTNLTDYWCKVALQATCTMPWRAASLLKLMLPLQADWHSRGKGHDCTRKGAAGAVARGPALAARKSQLLLQACARFSGGLGVDYVHTVRWTADAESALPVAEAGLRAATRLAGGMPQSRLSRQKPEMVLTIAARVGPALVSTMLPQAALAASLELTKAALAAAPAGVTPAAMFVKHTADLAEDCLALQPGGALTGDHILATRAAAAGAFAACCASVRLPKRTAGGGGYGLQRRLRVAMRLLGVWQDAPGRPQRAAPGATAAAVRLRYRRQPAADAASEMLSKFALQALAATSLQLLGRDFARSYGGGDYGKTGSSSSECGAGGSKSDGGSSMGGGGGEGGGGGSEGGGGGSTAGGGSSECGGGAGSKVGGGSSKDDGVGGSSTAGGGSSQGSGGGTATGQQPAAEVLAACGALAAMVRGLHWWCGRPVTAAAELPWTAVNAPAAAAGWLEGSNSSPRQPSPQLCFAVAQGGLHTTAVAIAAALSGLVRKQQPPGAACGR